ncbi:MAG TPA: NAD(+) diphosphatase [Syntrophorhabdaceae bacterium]|nr:NAD(+) diphosphatase [Syntrophorhabdaceae bacterium]
MDGIIVNTNVVLQDTNEPSFWFIFKGNKMLVREVGHELMVPMILNPKDINIKPTRFYNLGVLHGRPCYAVDIPESFSPPPDFSFQGLWFIYDYLDDELFNMAIKAKQIIIWDRTSIFCSRCGAKTKDKEKERAKECPDCGFVMFPRISPAIIVLVEKEDKVLLARAVRFKENIYSVLAGFVEPGETLEEAVEREVEEEVGIKIKDIRYFGSQPWPFPDSLMIAFIAKYKSGRIRINRNEIVDAGWFSYDNLPDIPSNISIARRMIDWFIQRHRGKK